jgi:uncharacterized OsmC-like protein
MAGGPGATPAQVMRSGLAACLAIGYRLWGARLGIVLDEIVVQLTCEIDARRPAPRGRGPCGLAARRRSVRVVTDTPEEDVYASSTRPIA